jgi:hypothetical protein
VEKIRSTPQGLPEKINLILAPSGIAIWYSPSSLAQPICILAVFTPHQMETACVFLGKIAVSRLLLMSHAYLFDRPTVDGFCFLY